MRFLSRVVWSEGMHLGPEHFQMQSRYFEDSLWFLIASIRNHPWGLLSLKLDNDAIRNGRAVVSHASGIFPDGLPFEFPESDAAPEELQIRQLFSASDVEITLHLAIAERRAQGVEASQSKGYGARYNTVERSLRDETIASEEHPVTLGRKNLGLVSSAGLLPGLVSIPIARIVRDGNSGFLADPAFLPPMLRISVIEDLLLRTRRLTDAIEEKIAVTRRGRKSVGKFEAGTSALDVASYWFLHALSSSLPALRHQLATRTGHPEQLYEVLAELAGALCTFSVEQDSDPARIPPYDHLDLNRTFSLLESQIRKDMNIVLDPNTVTLEFERSSPYIYTAPVADERCLRRSRWIFGIRSNIPELQLMQLTPNLVKVCSDRGVTHLVRNALSGLKLTHLPVPPSALAAQADMVYFTLELAEVCWQDIQRQRKVGVYIPVDLGDVVFEVTVILEINS